MKDGIFYKLGVGGLLLAIAFFGYSAYTLCAAAGAPKAEDIVLSSGNLVVFRDVVAPLSVAKAQQELLDKDKKLPAGVPIYLYLDTPGGDIGAGNFLNGTVLGLHRPVHTISTFAASMGFSFVQTMGKRYITPAGTLMAHRARIDGLGGQVPGEAVTALNFVLTTVTKMEKQNAARMGISFPAYTALVKDEYWVTGEDAVAQGAADAVANISCDDSLAGTNEQTFDTMFGEAKVTFANCPAISAPLDVKFMGGADSAEAQKALSSYSKLRETLIGGELKKP